MRPTVSDVTEQWYSELGAWTKGDEDEGWPLLLWLESAGRQIQEIYDLVMPGGAGRSPMSALFDIATMPEERLAYAAQYVGVSFPGGLDAASKRTLITDHPAFGRGRPEQIVAAAQRFLSGTKTVRMIERYNGSAYQIYVAVYADEAAGDTYDTLSALYPTYDDFEAAYPSYDDLVNAADVQGAVIAAIPGGNILTFVVLTGATYDELSAEFSTYDALAAEFATYDEMKAYVPGSA